MIDSYYRVQKKYAFFGKGNKILAFKIGRPDEIRIRSEKKGMTIKFGEFV